jgi:anti-anti-sigma factor
MAAAPNDQAPPFEVTVHLDGRTARVALAGELDMASVPELRRRVGELNEANHDHLVLDLSALEFIDSSGLHFIVLMDREFGGGRGGFEIVPAGQPVHSVFELCGLHEVLPFRAG